MRRLPRWLVAALVLLPAFAPDSLARPPDPFRVRDTAGRPLAHAKISVVGRPGSVTADAEGRFYLSPEPDPPFELVVFSEEGVFLGLIRIEQLPSEGVRELTIPPRQEVEVRVRSGLAPATQAPPASAATVIGRGETDRREPARLVDLIEEVPGTERVGAGQSAVPAVRGMARGRTLLLIDDARVASERRAGPSATFLNPFAADLVEIVRGPGSVAYGSDALGGILHVRTPVPRSEAFTVRWETGGGTGIGRAEGGLEANVPAGSGAWLVSVHQRWFGDYKTPQGVVENSQARDRGLLIKALVPVGGARWVVAAMASEAFDVGKPRRDPEGALTLYPEETSHRLHLAGSIPLSDSFEPVELRAFVGRYRLITDRMTSASLTAPEQVDRSDVEATDAMLRAVAARPLHEGRIRFGLEFNGRLNLHARSIQFDRNAQGLPVNRTESDAVQNADRYDSGLFAEGERNLFDGDLTLLAGARLQHTRTRNRGGVFGDRSTSHSTVSGYLAGTIRPAPPWSVTLQAARGFREPTLSDRFFAGVTGRGFVTGNPDLVPETSRQWDLAVQRAGVLTRVAFYAYHYTLEDLVERFRVGPTDFAFRNRGEARFRGFEVEGEVHVGRNFSTRLTLSHARGRVVDDGTPAADVPGPAAAVHVFHRPGPRFWWRGAVVWKLRDDRPGPGEAVVPGYSLLEGAVGWKLREGLEVRVLGQNLTDRVYPASSADDSVAGPGRSWFVGLAGRY